MVIKGLWVFTGDAVACKWKSIDPLRDPNEHTNFGVVEDVAFAVHPKTGKIESGFALRDTRTGEVEGYAESMIVSLEFLNSLRGQVDVREFPKTFGQKRIFIPDEKTVRDFA